MVCYSTFNSSKISVFLTALLVVISDTLGVFAKSFCFIDRFAFKHPFVAKVSSKVSFKVSSLSCFSGSLIRSIEGKHQVFGS